MKNIQQYSEMYLRKTISYTWQKYFYIEKYNIFIIKKAETLSVSPFLSAHSAVNIVAQ